MSDIKDWSTTAADNNAAAPNGFPEGMAPSGVNNSCREVLAAVRTQHEDSSWVDFGHTVTYATTTTFTIAGDYTTLYTANRRIRCTDSSTLYGNITSSSYGSPNTTVTVVLDSGVLSGSLTAAAVSVVDANGAPTDLSGDLTVTGTITGNVTGDLTGNADTVTTIPTLSGDVTNSGNTITIAAGAVEVGMMAANSVDSAQYVDASIDQVHLAPNSVDSENYVDGSIDAVHLASGITFPSDTSMLFRQTTAPTGWTKNTSFDNHALKVETGTATSGGTLNFSTFLADTETGSTPLSTAQMPSHTHTGPSHTHTGPDHFHTLNGIAGAASGAAFTALTESGTGKQTGSSGTGATGASGTGATGSTGSGSGHTHTLAQNIKYVDVIIAEKD